MQKVVRKRQENYCVGGNKTLLRCKFCTVGKRSERIWYGDKENIDLGTEQEFWMVLPKAEIPHIKAKYTLDGKELTAPISAHQRVGEIELYDRDKQVAHWPLVTLESVGEGGMFSRLSDYFHHKA